MALSELRIYRLWLFPNQGYAESWGVATENYWGGADIPASFGTLLSYLYNGIYRFFQGFYKRYLIENIEIHNKIIKVLISRIFQKILVFSISERPMQGAGEVSPPIPKHTISIAASIKYFGCRSTLDGETRIYLGDFFWFI